MKVHTPSTAAAGLRALAGYRPARGRRAKIRPERLLWGMAGVLALALLAAWLARPTLTAEIAPAHIVATTGQAYAAEALFGNRALYAAPADSLRDKTRSGLELLEDGVPLGPAHAGHRQISEAGRGAYSHWTPNLLFSSSDGTDPRVNGRRYTIRAAAEVKPAVLWPGLWLMAAAAAGALSLRHRARLGRGLRYCRRVLAGAEAQRVSGANSSLAEIGRTAWPFTVPALFACLMVAPLVNLDSVIIASYSLSGSLPHYPPLYPVFVHAMSAAASALGWMAGGPAPHLGLADPAPFTPLAATLTLLAQHALALASAAYLANRLRPGRSDRRDRLVRRLIVAALYLNPLTLQLVHGVFSEALVIPAAFAAAAEAWVILTRPRRPLRHYAAFLAWVLLAALARHPAIVLGALLPIGFALKGAAALARRNWWGLRASLAAVGLVALGLAGVQAANVLVNTAVMLQVDVEPRPVPGRAFTYRLCESCTSSFWLPGLDKDGFERVVAHLEATADDPELRQDIETVARTPNAWIGPYLEVHKSVQRQCPDCDQAQTTAETDRRLNRVMTHTVLSLQPDLVRDTFLRVVNFLAAYRADQPYRVAVGADMAGMPMFDPSPGFRWQGRNLEPAIEAASRFERDFVFTIACAVVLLALRRRRRLGTFALSLLATGVVYSVLVSLVTVYMPRYGLFVDLLALVALAAVLGARSVPPASGEADLRLGSTG